MGEQRTDPLEVVANRYRILQPIAGGEACDTYAAADTHRDDVRVFVKILRADADDDARAAFDRERRFLIALRDSDATPKLLDVSDHQGRPVLVLEAARGRPLTELAKQPLPPGRARRMLRATALALRDVHRHHVIVVDLKPPHVFYDIDTNSAQIVDYGAAQTTNAPRMGRPMGTPPFAAPQVYDPEAGLTTATDVFALGVMMRVIGWIDPTRRSQRLDEEQRLLARLATRATERDPRKRPSLDEIIEALERGPHAALTWPRLVWPRLRLPHLDIAQFINFEALRRHTNAEISQELPGALAAVPLIAVLGGAATWIVALSQVTSFLFMRGWGTFAAIVSALATAAVFWWHGNAGTAALVLVTTLALLISEYPAIAVVTCLAMAVALPVQPAVAFALLLVGGMLFRERVAGVFVWAGLLAASTIDPTVLDRQTVLLDAVARWLESAGRGPSPLDALGLLVASVGAAVVLAWATFPLLAADSWYEKVHEIVVWVPARNAIQRIWPLATYLGLAIVYAKVIGLSWTSPAALQIAGAAVVAAILSPVPAHPLAAHTMATRHQLMDAVGEVFGALALVAYVLAGSAYLRNELSFTAAAVLVGSPQLGLYWTLRRITDWRIAVAEREHAPIGAVAAGALAA